MEDNVFSPTNTFASTPFDVLKVEGIEDPMIDVNKMATIDLSESYFESAVKFITESHTEMTNAKMTLYKSLSEATTDTVVLESFSDFFSSVKDIIVKFLKFIKRLFERFLATLNKFISSDTFIKKNKDTILKFNSDCEFDMTGYNFTFEPNVPVASAITSITDDLFADLKTVSNGELSAENIKAINDRYSYDEDYYDDFRGKVLNRDGDKITATDFQEELFRAFRDDSLEVETITVDPAKVMDSYRRFSNFKETKKQAEREQHNIEKEYNNLKDEIKKLSNKGILNVPAILGFIGDVSNITTIDGQNISGINSNTGYQSSSELAIAFDIFAKNKADQVQRCSDIHVLAYSAKLDAIKECFKQDKALLYKAYSMVKKKGVE